MRVFIAPKLHKNLKKQDVRIRKNFEKALKIFSENPETPQLDNHSLQKEWMGFRSIDITADWRAIFEYKTVGDKMVAYFVEIGTHKQLFSSRFV